MAKKAVARNVLDFSRAWELSDVVLLVEGNRFHVHRTILAMWSPVFSRMFTADVKDKTAYEIPLPGKKANEIEEMLLVIYPPSSKEIDESNVWFLLCLAKEYIMTKLKEKCEDYLMNTLENSELQSCISYGRQNRPCYPNQRCLDLLEIAQYYELERLQKECVAKAQTISFRELKRHETYEKISLSNYRKIAEGKIKELEQKLAAKNNDSERLESESRRIKSQAADAFEKFEKVVDSFVFWVLRSPKRSSLSYDVNPLHSLDEKLFFLQDVSSDLSEKFSDLRNVLEEIKP